MSALEDLARARLSDLWETTLAMLEHGAAEDQRGNYAAACLQYSEAIGGLQALLELESDARRTELLTARLTEYSLRLQQLNSMRLNAAAAPPVAMPAVPTALLAQPQPPAAGPQPAPAVSDGLTIEAKAAASDATTPLANARLATELAVQADEAGDTAEALELYTAAIEAYLTAMKLEPVAAAEHRKIMSGLLDRAEQIKSGGRPAAAPAAAPGISLPSPPAAAAAAAPSAAAPPRPPAAGQAFTEEEKMVLARSSTINGKMCYPHVQMAVLVASYLATSSSSGCI